MGTLYTKPLKHLAKEHWSQMTSLHLQRPKSAESTTLQYQALQSGEFSFYLKLIYYNLQILAFRDFTQI